MSFKDVIKKNKESFLNNGVNLIVLSILTGLLAGVVVTFYNILVHFGEESSQKIYALLRAYPAFIPLLFITLAAGAIVIGTLVKFVPMVRGSGIPQTEGAARGLFALKWYVTLCSAFAASLACVFLGLSAGGEGPSIQIGGCVGEGVGVTLKRSQMIKRLQISAGASAGLAVAFNAPLTGLIFSLEEAFRSFSAQIFICSALSVASGLLVGNLLRDLMGYSVGFTFENFVFTNVGLDNVPYVLLAAVLTAICGVAFYYCVFLAKKALKKLTFLKGVGKFLIPFLLAGIFGLITPYAMGGGHSFIQDLATSGTGQFHLQSLITSSILGTLLFVFAFKFISAVACMGCGVPCGVFIPMLAVGACLGGILSELCKLMGMDPVCADYLVIICMSVFFVTVVKAPITAIIMTFELTGQIQNVLPALIGVAVGYLVSELFKVEPIYERLLDEFVKEEGISEGLKLIKVSAVIQPNSVADDKFVRSIIWPANGLVVEVVDSEGNKFVPEGETKLIAGQTIVFEGKAKGEDELLNYIYDITGKN
ncbi:MAG: ClC family H(+)/Cl(-) exchange transporter [Clostridia bacterium]|nr:ClC family H(+)/Cl(-) exchange transporter [Clostridia bacterium]